MKKTLSQEGGTLTIEGVSNIAMGSNLVFIIHILRRNIYETMLIPLCFIIACELTLALL